MRFFGCSLAGKILKDVNRYINGGCDNFTFYFFLLKHNSANIYCILSNEKKKEREKIVSFGIKLYFATLPIIFLKT